MTLYFKRKCHSLMEILVSLNFHKIVITAHFREVQRYSILPLSPAVVPQLSCTLKNVVFKSFVGKQVVTNCCARHEKQLESSRAVRTQKCSCFNDNGYNVVYRLVIRYKFWYSQIYTEFDKMFQSVTLSVTVELKEIAGFNYIKLDVCVFYFFNACISLNN